MLNKFHPANAANITDEDIQEMRGLNFEQVKELAETYPNAASGNGYLVLYDDNKKVNEQHYPVSSWPNLLTLWNLKETKYKPFEYYSRFFKKPVAGIRNLPIAIADISLEEIKKELKPAEADPEINKETKTKK